MALAHIVVDGGRHVICVLNCADERLLFFLSGRIDTDACGRAIRRILVKLLMIRENDSFLIRQTGRVGRWCRHSRELGRHLRVME